jgi:hypothetical membrane protein
MCQQRIEPGFDAGTRGLVGCGFLAPLVAIGTFLAAAAGRPGYDHVADTVSKLNARGDEGSWVWTAGLIAYSLLMGLFAAGLRRRFRRIASGGVLWSAVLLHAGAMVAVALFRDDLEPGGFFSVEGAVHDVVSGVAFSALVVAMLAAWRMAGQDSMLRAARRPTALLGLTMTACGIIFLFTPVAYQGVPQRIFLTLAAIWIMALAVQSRRRPHD